MKLASIKYIKWIGFITAIVIIIIRVINFKKKENTQRSYTVIDYRDDATSTLESIDIGLTGYSNHYGNVIAVPTFYGDKIYGFIYSTPQSILYDYNFEML